MSERSYHLRVWTRLRATPEAAEAAFAAAPPSWLGRLGLGPDALCARFDSTHTVEAASDGCRYIDAVDFTVRGPAAPLLAELLAWRLSAAHHRVAQGLEHDTRATGVAMLRELPPPEGV